MRCLECGAEPAEIAQVCARCEAPIGLRQSVAGDGAAGSAQVRCLECGAEPAEIAQVCARCGAPAGLEQSAAGAQAAGEPGNSAAPLPADALDGPPSQQTRHGNSRRKALAMAGVAAALVITLITVIAVTNSSGPAPNQLAFDQLRPGDCLVGSNMGLGTSSPWPDYVTRVPCTKPHIAEIFFAGDIWPQSMPFPGQGTVNKESYARCDAAFAAYDGVSTQQSLFTFDDIVPFSDAWAAGSRSVACVAYEWISPGKVSVDFSLKGSDR